MAHEDALAKAASREQPTVEMDVVDDVASLGAELAAAEAAEDVSVKEAPAHELARLEERVGDGAAVRSAAREKADRLVAQLEEMAERWATDPEAVAEVAEPDVEEPEPEPVAEPAAEQPTVETEALRRDDVVAWSPPQPPIAATPTAAAYAHHPAFAVETDDVSDLPPLAAALAAAAADERAAAEAIAAAAVVEPEVAPSPAADPVRPVVQLQRAPRRRFARGGLLIGLLLAIVRFLLGRR